MSDYHTAQSHTHIHTNQLSVCVFGLGEEARVPGGNPLMHSENMQTPHTLVEVGIEP